MQFLVSIFEFFVGHKLFNSLEGGSSQQNEGGGGFLDGIMSFIKSLLGGGDDKQQASNTQNNAKTDNTQAATTATKQDQTQQPASGGNFFTNIYDKVTNAYDNVTTWVSNTWNDITGKTKEKIQHATDFFIKKGWTKEQAAGIVANLHSESDMNISAKGDSGLAYGVAQWHPDRQADFKAKYGIDIRNANLDQQLDFVDYELRQGSRKSAGNQLKTASTAQQAGEIVSKKYEAPRNVVAEATKRGALAAKIDNSLILNNGQDVASVSTPMITPKASGQVLGAHAREQV